MRNGSAVWRQCGQRALKIGSTRRVIGKQLLKLRQRLGKNQIVALEDVHDRHDGQRYT